MTEFSAGIYEDGENNLTDINGRVLVPVEKRRQCLVYSRVVGYLSPAGNWNKGKQAEWADRVVFVPPQKVTA